MLTLLQTATGVASRGGCVIKAVSYLQNPKFGRQRCFRAGSDSSYSCKKKNTIKKKQISIKAGIPAEPQGTS